MLRELWPDLIEGPLPSSPGIWEATRFCCDPQLSPQLRRRIVGDLICGCQEFGIEHGIAKYLSVMPVGLFRQVIIASGCDVTFLGPSRRMGRHEVAAAYVDVSTATLANVRCRGQHRDGALGHNLSMAA
jgi:N-acyl-L-homoserine lactone synthetase